MKTPEAFKNCLLSMHLSNGLRSRPDHSNVPSRSRIAALADYRLRGTPEQLRDALGACQQLDPPYRRLLKAALEELELIDKQIGQLDQEMADLLRPYQDQVERLAEVPGLPVDAAQQIIAQVGTQA